MKIVAVLQYYVQWVSIWDLRDKKKLTTLDKEEA